MTEYITEETRHTPIAEKTDVVVVGGGPAGIVAAIAAARSGADTILIESEGYLGGIAAMNIPLQGFHNNQKEKIVDGIPWELIQDMIDEGSSPGPWPHVGRKRASGATIMYDNSRFKVLALKKLIEAGVKLMLHTLVSEPIMEGNKVKGVFIESKSGRQAILADSIVDASGDGDVAARGGAEYEKGNSQGYCQPVTIIFKISNVDMESFLGDVDANPAAYNLEIESPGYWESYQKGVRPGISGLKDFFTKAQQTGQYDMPNPLFAVGCLPNPGEVVVNMVLVKGIDSTNNLDLTRAEITGYQGVHKTMDFLKKHIKGFKNAWVSEIGPSLGIRESRRIIGEHVLDIKEMVDCKKNDDRIAIGARSVDIHDPTPDNSQPCSDMYMVFPKGYYIPYRSLIPRDIDNVILAGRCISVSYKAFGSTRVMGQCMATGHAAGVAAALSSKQNIEPRKLVVSEIQEILRKQNALID